MRINKLIMLHQNKGNQGSGVVGTRGENDANPIMSGMAPANIKPDATQAQINPPPTVTFIPSWAV